MAYAEDLVHAKMLKNEMNFRELSEFKLHRINGHFKEIGI